LKNEVKKKMMMSACESLYQSHREQFSWKKVNENFWMVHGERRLLVET